MVRVDIEIALRSVRAIMGPPRSGRARVRSSRPSPLLGRAPAEVTGTAPATGVQGATEPAAAWARSVATGWAVGEVGLAMVARVVHARWLVGPRSRTRAARARRPRGGSPIPRPRSAASAMPRRGRGTNGRARRRLGASRRSSWWTPFDGAMGGASLVAHAGTRPRNSSERTATIRNTTKRILATPAAAPAIPVKPSTAAPSAMAKKTAVQ